MPDGTGYAPVDGGRLYYERTGNGNPIIWLHAGFLDRRMWERPFGHFARSYDLIRYDQRGYGLSDPAEVDYIESRDLCFLMDHLGLGSAYLVGSAMGGRIALDFAADYPNRTDGVVVIAPSVAGYRPASPEEDAMWEEIDQREEAVEALAATPGPAAIAAKLDLWAPLVDAETRARLGTIAAENRDKALGRTSPHRKQTLPATMDRLWAVLAPVLILTGDQDFPVYRTVADTLAEKLPNGQHKIVEGADHMVSLSKPAEFLGLLDGFFARLDFVAMQRGTTH